MPVCGVSVLFRLNICFGGIARLERQISAALVGIDGLLASILAMALGGLCATLVAWWGLVGLVFDVLWPLIGLIHAALIPAVD